MCNSTITINDVMSIDLLLIVKVISSIISIISCISSYFRLIFHPYIIKLEIEKPKPEIYDDIVVLKLSENTNFNLGISYRINKHVSLVRKIAKYLNIEKIKLKLLIGRGYSTIIFSTRKGVSENIAIIPAKATSSKYVFTCSFRLDENLENSEIIPEVDLEFTEGTPRIKRFLAKYVFFRIKVEWKQGNKVIIKKERNYDQI